MSEVVKIDPDIDKSSRETNCDRRKARQAELNNKLVRSVSLDAGYSGTSNSYKKLKLTDDNEEVILGYYINVTIILKTLIILGNNNHQTAYV